MAKPLLLAVGLDFMVMIWEASVVTYTVSCIGASHNFDGEERMFICICILQSNGLHIACQ